jgi:hypothetical protein
VKTCFSKLERAAKKVLEVVLKNMQFAWKTGIDTVLLFSFSNIFAKSCPAQVLKES